MKDKKKTIEVQLLNRQLKIKTPQDKEEDLKQAAYYLNGKMREVRESGAATGNEHIALLAAINMAYELITTRKEKDVYLDSVADQIKEIELNIEDAHGPEKEDMF